MIAIPLKVITMRDYNHEMTPAGPNGVWLQKFAASLEGLQNKLLSYKTHCKCVCMCTRGLLAYNTFFLVKIYP